MRQEHFEARFGADWNAFENWLALHGKKSVAAESILPPREIPVRYRNLVRQLALARDRHYGADLVDRLEKLVLEGHQVIYGARSGEKNSVLRFVRETFPRTVRKCWRSVTVASLSFLGTLALVIAIIQFFPDFAYVLTSPEQLAQMQQMYDPANKRIALRSADTDVVMWGHYISNNVKIGFQCFAGGLLFGVGSLFFLLLNGLQIGAVAGHITHIGYIETFWGFVAGHAALELGGIVLCGAAGLQMGYALIAPGRRTRLESLKAAMPDAVTIVYGASTMIFAAAFIEAFWSSSRIPPVEFKYAVGIAFWVVLIVYLVFVGRSAQSAFDARQSRSEGRAAQ
jgi:uncharacterized membrane protein SpoIIM required for sporulation